MTPYRCADANEAKRLESTLVERKLIVSEKLAKQYHFSLQREYVEKHTGQ
jgi:hypothetical protein